MRIYWKCVADSPVQIRLFPFDINGINWIESKPSGEGEAVFVGPPGQWWQHDGRTFSSGETEKDVRTISMRHLTENVEKFCRVTRLKRKMDE